MKKYVQAEFRKGKTDKIDSIRIANYGIDRWYKLVDFTFPEEVYAQLRFLGRQYAHYITLKIESKLSLTSILDQTMPGIKRLLKSNRSEIPTKDKLADFVEDTGILTISGRKVRPNSSAAISNEVTKQ